MTTPVEPAHTYHTWLTWTDRRGTLAARAGEPLAVAVPRDFGGTGDAWSPEELLVGATEACLVATFAAIAKRRGLRLSGCQSSASGTLGRSATGLAFTGISIVLRISVSSESERGLAAAVAKQAHGACVVAGSLRCPVALDYTIDVDETAAAEPARRAS